ncbi:LLM class flavin-dependent oxidoreductase [Streptomyces sp. NPDC006649]|uniref:LLM class flavin-dependent oxidoreductase n=1 Tax=Streptomyces sp. NPDC006649 TaxID=3156896 RepID=UPI0033BEB146
MPVTSVMFPVQAQNIGSTVPFARLLQQRGEGRMWMGQSLSLESHHVFAALAGMGLRIPFGTSVVLSPLRHPYQAAVSARSVAALSGHSYVAGIGPGSSEFQATVSPATKAKPVSAVREYAHTMRALLDGEGPHTTSGTFDTVGAGLMPFAHPEVEVGLGVLRPAMARAAGRAADVAITWLAPPSYLRDVLMPEMTVSAQTADRTPPRVASVVHAAVDRPGRDLVQAALTAVGPHLASTHYTDMLRQGGIAAHPAEPQLGAEQLVKSGVFASGTPAEIAAQITEYHRIGVSEVMVNVCGVYLTEGAGAALRDLSAILNAVDEAAHV